MPIRGENEMPKTLGFYMEKQISWPVVRPSMF